MNRHEPSFYRKAISFFTAGHSIAAERPAVFLPAPVACSCRQSVMHIETSDIVVEGKNA